MRYKQEPGPPVAVGQAVIFIIQRGYYGFAGAGGGNNKVFEALAVFALYLERLVCYEFLRLNAAYQNAKAPRPADIMAPEMSAPFTGT